MTTERSGQIAVIAIAALITACGGGAERPPTVIRDAREQTADGRDAFAAGALDEAALAYGRALDLYRSIDDPVGIVRSLLNMAVVRNTAGRPADAHACLDAIDRYAATLAGSQAAARQPAEFGELLAEAAWLRAFLHADAGRADAAAAALAAATPPPPALAGRFANLEARIMLDRGEPAAALAAAERALAANRRRNDRSEAADSHRFIGRAALAGGQPARALEAFGAALELDRALARPAKVVDDLTGMSAAARALGRPDQAAAFAERAGLAARAARVNAGG